MTIKEALSLSVKSMGVDPLLIDKALIDAGISETANYTAADKLKVYQLEYDLLTSPIFIESITEGGYSVKYNTSGIATRLTFLSHALGLTVQGTPTISDASHLW